MHPSPSRAAADTLVGRHPEPSTRARSRRWLAVTAAVATSCAVLLTGTPPATAASGLPALPLSTDGNEIVDARGNEVVLQGVNWFGFETANHAPHGLWSRDYKDMLRQIKQQGFNTIRMPFSLEALESATTSGIDYASGRNAALKGKTPQQAMDVIIDEAGRQGLMVILDNHSQSDDGFMYDLWFGQGGYTENDWVQAWSRLAERYEDSPHVIAADLKNEPHGSATWGTGGATDWRRAAERAGNIVLGQNPDLLILVEGIEQPVAGGRLDRHWWGGNLEGVRRNPVRLNVADKLVYSPHEYGPGVFAQPWFSDPNMADILESRWDAGFGYIHDNDIAPLLVGEFGAKNVGTDTTEGRWIRQFADYLGRKGISWTFWSWNPNSGDTGGVLKDDWQTVHADKMGLLSDLMDRRPMDFGAISSPPATAEPELPDTDDSFGEDASGEDTSTTEVGSGALTMSVVTDSTWNSGWCGHVVVNNTGRSASDIVSMSVTLRSGQTLGSVWNGEATVDGRVLSITAPAWATAPAGGNYSDTGFCINGTGTPRALAVTTPDGAVDSGEDAAGDVGPAPAPLPTPTPAPAPTPTSPTPTAPDTTLAITWRADSTWDGGYCRTAVVTNAGSTASGPWSLRFILPAGSRITTHWNGTVSSSDGATTVTPPTWLTSIPAGGASADFGFCASGVWESVDTRVSSL